MSSPPPEFKMAAPRTRSVSRVDDHLHEARRRTPLDGARDVRERNRAHEHAATARASRSINPTCPSSGIGERRVGHDTPGRERSGSCCS